MSLTLWDKRPREEAYLFNPAFCAALLHEFVKEFQKAKGQAAPYALLFCALPIAPHGKTRRALPGSTVTSLYSWRERNPEVLVGFAERARSLRPIVQEALRFAIDRSALAFAEDGGVMLGNRALSIARKFEETLTDDARDCVAATRLLGRWLAKAGTASTIMAAYPFPVRSRSRQNRMMRERAVARKISASWNRRPASTISPAFTRSPSPPCPTRRPAC